MKTSQIMYMVPTSLSHQDTRSLISHRHVRMKRYLLLNLSFLTLYLQYFFFYRSSWKINKNEIPALENKQKRVDETLRNNN